MDRGEARKLLRAKKREARIASIERRLDRLENILLGSTVSKHPGEVLIQTDNADELCDLLIDLIDTGSDDSRSEEL